MFFFEHTNVNYAAYYMLELNTTKNESRFIKFSEKKLKTLSKSIFEIENEPDLFKSDII